jgi:hypothetical protein
VWVLDLVCKDYFGNHEAKRLSTQQKSVMIELSFKIELKSLILAQIERWRHALHMQVERG